MQYPLRKQLAAEAIGTFCLVFAGTGAIVVNQLFDGLITHGGIALCFGLIVMVMIYALGDISGAHFNPAVSLAFAAARRLSLGRAGLFILSQFAGAVLASLCLRLMFPGGGLLGATQPTAGVELSFAFEVIVTFLLMFVILGVSTGAKEKGITAGLAIGATVMLAALFAGPISGASMNPARSFGPALASTEFSHLWVYFTAPVLGGLLAVGACRCVRESGCCDASGSVSS